MTEKQMAMDIYVTIAKKYHHFTDCFAVGPLDAERIDTERGLTATVYRALKNKTGFTEEEYNNFIKSDLND